MQHLEHSLHLERIFVSEVQDKVARPDLIIERSPGLQQSRCDDLSSRLVEVGCSLNSSCLLTRELPVDCSPRICHGMSCMGSNMRIWARPLPDGDSGCAPSDETSTMKETRM